MLKKDTLVALLDGTLQVSATSLANDVEAAKRIPNAVRKFKHLVSFPKLVDKILIAIDAKKFNPKLLEDEGCRVRDKVGMICMALKETPESDMPSVYLLELQSEQRFLSAVSQKCSDAVGSIAELKLAVLKWGYYVVDRDKITWAWTVGEDKKIPTVSLADLGETVDVHDRFDIDSVATVTTKSGIAMTTGPLRLLFEQEGVDFDGFKQPWVVDGCTRILSPAAKRQLAKASLSGSPKKKRRGKGTALTVAAGNVSDALSRRLLGSSSGSNARPTAAQVLGGTS
jgi:hypothetical protein